MDDIIISIVLSGEHSTLHLIEYTATVVFDKLLFTQELVAVPTLHRRKKFNRDKTKRRISSNLSFFCCCCYCILPISAIEIECRRYSRLSLLSHCCFCLIINFCYRCFKNSLPICVRFCFVMLCISGASSCFEFANIKPKNESIAHHMIRFVIPYPCIKRVTYIHCLSLSLYRVYVYFLFLIYIIHMHTYSHCCC